MYTLFSDEVTKVPLPVSYLPEGRRMGLGFGYGVCIGVF
jgi:hypothetical protein